MKNTLSISLMLATASVASFASAANVSVVVKNVASSAGVVRGTLCDKETFLKTCALTASEKANADTATLVFKNVPPGKYAFNAYHDENDNKKMNRNWIGIPTEGYAFSRDAKGRRGPPAFEEAAFDVKDGNNDISVTLSY